VTPVPNRKWQVYRNRYLIKAKQLTRALVFVDPLGREHRGKKGDYLVESDGGTRRIWPRALFEDSHVPMQVAVPETVFPKDLGPGGYGPEFGPSPGAPAQPGGGRPLWKNSDSTPHPDC
jgi:hypothetical protein